MRPPIFITGCARSGTSMTAGIVHLCGAFGGKMSGATPYNRKGMFENAEIRNQIVKPYLTHIGADPMGQNPLPNVTALEPYPGLKIKVETVMKYNGYKDGPWFYKGAKLCLLWPLFHEAFPSAKWIIVRRADEDIVNSCMKTAFMRAYNDEGGWQSWVDHHKDRFSEMKKAGLHIAEVWPTKFVEGSFSEIQRVVIRFLRLRWRDKKVRDFIEPAYWSTKHGK